MFVCTDVHLKDNPKLAEVWATESFHNTKPQESLPLSQSTSTVMPLLSMEVWPTSPQIEAVTQTWSVDTSAKDSSGPPGRNQLAHHCPVCCQKPVSQIKSHVLQLHLAYYTSPGTVCFCCEINYATMSSLSHHLQSSHTTLSGHLEMGAKFEDGLLAPEFCHHMAGLLVAKFKCEVTSGSCDTDQEIT